MKKQIAALLTVIMVFAGSVSVFADNSVQNTYNSEKSTTEDQYFTTSGTIADNAGGYVTLLVTNGNDITVDSIMYIDQTQANDAGAFSFTDYIPKINLVQNQEYKVRVGATVLTAPIDGGVLKLPEVASGYIVSGKLTYVGNKTQPVIQLLKADGTEVAKAETGSDGVANYTFENVGDGTYTLKFSKVSSLTEKTPVTVAGSNVTVPDMRLLVGDVNADNAVSVFDLTEVIAVLGSKENDADYRAAADVDENGTVSILDLTSVIANLGERRAD